jgi:hypothetical protein
VLHQDEIHPSIREAILGELDRGAKDGRVWDFDLDEDRVDFADRVVTWIPQTEKPWDCCLVCKTESACTSERICAETKKPLIERCPDGQKCGCVTTGCWGECSRLPKKIGNNVFSAY